MKAIIAPPAVRERPASLPLAAIWHGKCGQWWTGATRGHCSNCHATFTAGAFDRHFTRLPGGRMHCDPAGRGLTPHPRPWGTLWTAPGGYWPASETVDEESVADE